MRTARYAPRMSTNARTTTKPIPDGYHTVTPYLMSKRRGQADRLYEARVWRAGNHASSDAGGQGDARRGADR